ncbi:MAG: hypothetical protein QM784_19635 [Polyangiaceae bacterium]
MAHLVGYDNEHSSVGFGYGLALDPEGRRVIVTRKGQYYAIRLDICFPEGRKPCRIVTLASIRIFAGLRRSGRRTRLWAYESLPTVSLEMLPYTSWLATTTRRLLADRRVYAASQRNGITGRAKAFMNVQLRQVLFDFNLLGKTNLLALALFCDVGRVWADYGARADLDGRHLGLKWEVGAGPHVIAGKSFVIRADVAWSPDANPIAAYLAAGEIF